jgi:hypothetical protein
MGLDSNGTCDGELKMAVGNGSAIVARVRDRDSVEVADDLGHRFWRLLPYGRQSKTEDANKKKETPRVMNTLQFIKDTTYQT